MFFFAMVVFLVPFKDSSIVLTTYAEEIVDSGTWGDNISYVITGVKEEGYTLRISGSGEIKDFSSYRVTAWRGYRSGIKHIIIENGVTGIGVYAFDDFSVLETVELPNTLKSIGRYAFSECDMLQEIWLPDSVNFIDSFAFYKCLNLSKIRFPATLSSIENYVFEYCGFTELEFPNSLVSIGNGAFGYCKELSKVSLPANLKVLGSSVFYESPIEKVVLPDFLESIAGTTFKSKTQIYARENTLTAATLDAINEKWIDYRCFAGHIMKDYITPASTKNSGKIETKCSVCGILEKEQKIDRVWVWADTSYNDYVYDGIKKEPEVTVDLGYPEYEGDHYKIEYHDNLYSGLATVKVIFSGYYEGTWTDTFEIVPEQISLSELVPEEGAIRIKWNPTSDQVSGYEIEYEDSSYMEQSVKVEAGASEYLLQQLSAEESYEIRIRPYKQVGSEIYYGAWSYSREASPDKTIAQKITLPKKVVIAKGLTRTIKPSYDSDNCYLGSLKWSTTNKKIATVDKKGKVTAKKVGTCKIKCKYKGKTYKCTVQVKANKFKGKKLSQVYVDDYRYGQVSFETNSIEYKDGKVILKVVAVNNRIFRADKFTYITIGVYDDNSKKIAKQKFNNVYIGLQPDGKKYMTFTFSKKNVKKKVYDLRDAYITYDYYYRYSY